MDAGDAAGRVPVAQEMVEELKRVPSQGWAEMIRKVYEVDPMICPRCGGRMRVVAFLTEHAVVKWSCSGARRIDDRSPDPPVDYRAAGWLTRPLTTSGGRIIFTARRERLMAGEDPYLSRSAKGKNIILRT